VTLAANDVGADEMPLDPAHVDALFGSGAAIRAPLRDTAAAPLHRVPAFDLVDARSIYAPRPPVPCLVDPVIRVGSVTLLGAFGGSGKTWLALDMLVAVGTGRRWLDHFDVKKGKATLLDYESGEHEAARRIIALSRSLPPKAAFPALDLAAMPTLYMGDPAFERAVTELARDRSLIVIDSLAAASPGAKENESTMRVGLDQLRRAAEKTRCAFLVLVHAKKVTGSPHKFDPREILRGSSAIYDAADTVLTVTFEKGKPLRLEQAKARHGVSIDPIEVSITDRDGGVVVAAKPPAIERDGVYMRLKAQLAVAARRVCPCSKNALAAEAKGTRTDKLAAIDEMVNDGTLSLVGGVYRICPSGSRTSPNHYPNRDT
jgi:hypothetical protein